MKNNLLKNHYLHFFLFLYMSRQYIYKNKTKKRQIDFFYKYFDV